MNSDNIDSLVSAANAKLSAQEKERQKNQGPVEDIYASFREDTNEESTSYLKQSQTSYDNDIIYNIQHSESEESEEEYQIQHEGEELFPDGPTLPEIELWKKQYGKEKVMHVQILEKNFVFRTLNRYEYKQIVAIENIDQLRREEIICTTCVLFPYVYDFKVMAKEDGGYPSTLAQIIMENSGFTKEYGISVL